MPRLPLRRAHAGGRCRIGTAPHSPHPPEKTAGADETVNVLLLTVFIGAVLVAFFVVMFLREVAGARGASERDALLPLTGETPRIARSRAEPGTPSTKANL